MGENIFWNKYDNVVVICASHNKWHSGISFEWEHWEGPGSSSAQIWIPSSKGCFNCQGLFYYCCILILLHVCPGLWDWHAFEQIGNPSTKRMLCYKFCCKKQNQQWQKQQRKCFRQITNFNQNERKSEQAHIHHVRSNIAWECFIQRMAIPSIRQKTSFIWVA